MWARACLTTLDKDHVHGPHLHLAELGKIDEAAKNLADALWLCASMQARRVGGAVGERVKA